MEIIKLLFENIKYLIILAIALLIIQLLKPVSDSVSAFFDRLNPPATAEIVSSQTIVNSITGLGQLVTVTVETSKVDVFVEVNKGRAEYYGAHHRSTGVIEAGIDFSDISRDSILYDAANEYYTVILPAPTITSCRIEDIKQYGWSVTVFQAPWDSVRRLAQFDSLKRFAEDMIEQGILDMAKSETGLRMGDFVSAITRTPVDIVFEESGDEAELPPSCEPEIPGGWTRDDATGHWKQTS